MNVLVGSGQSLVLGNQATRLTTVPDTYDGSRLELAVDNGGILQNISTKVNGGVVGGLLAFRNDVLDDARQDLGQLAVGLADAFNAQHRQGMDLSGNLGANFFTTTTPLTVGAPRPTPAPPWFRRSSRTPAASPAATMSCASTAPPGPCWTGDRCARAHDGCRNRSQPAALRGTGR